MNQVGPCSQVYLLLKFVIEDEIYIHMCICNQLRFFLLAIVRTVRMVLAARTKKHNSCFFFILRNQLFQFERCFVYFCSEKTKCFFISEKFIPCRRMHILWPNTIINEDYLRNFRFMICPFDILKLKNYDWKTEKNESLIILVAFDRLLYKKVYSFYLNTYSGATFNLIHWMNK